MNWTNFLHEVSNTLLQSEDLLHKFSENKSEGLSFPGISETEIQTHENRLNTTLPPSYKAFLKSSNGFKQLNCFVWDILPIEKIDWLKNFDPSFYELYATEFNDAFNAGDAEYFVYGDDQECTNFRSDYLIKSLAISDWGDAAIVLLNPEVKFGEEWEAWMFATWHLGPIRYRSFEELMKEEYKSYLDLINNT